MSTSPNPADLFIKSIADAVIERLQGHQVGPRLLPLKKAAEYLGMSEESLREKIGNRLIPVVRGDRHLRFDIRDLDSWIEANKER